MKKILINDKPIKVAIDGGNSTLKCSIQGTRMPLIPSIYSEVDVLNEYQEAFSDISKNELHSSLDVTIGGIRFLLGNLAEKNSKSKENRVNGDKHSDQILIRMQLAAIAFNLFKFSSERALIEKRERAVEFSISLGVLLPYIEVKNTEFQKEYALNFKGEHFVQFNHPAFKKAVKLNIESVVVQSEGEISSRTLKKKYSKCQPEELASKYLIGIDFGSFDTNIFTTFFEPHSDETFSYASTVKKVKPVTYSKLCAGTRKGIGNIHQDLIFWVKNNYEEMKSSNLIRKDIETAIFSKYEGRYGYIKPENIYIGQEWQRLCENFGKYFARILINNLANQKIRASEILEVVLVGGGANIKDLVRSFSETIKNSDYKNVIISVLPSEADSIYLNVDSLASVL